MITGTINSDGTIGDVGAVSAKASVAKDAGATLFLVPQGQGVATNYVPEQKCEQVASVTICTTVYKPSTETGEMGGIRVVEVSDIRDALKYFGL
jgi:predicted S18 family serine protease